MRKDNSLRMQWQNGISQVAMSCIIENSDNAMPIRHLAVELV